MRLRALAKINLALDVLREREDGYHEVRMVMQTISMYDLLDMNTTASPGIHLTTNLPYVPCDQRNLVYRAADLLMKEFQVERGVRIHLTKHIPVSAGMAGGSSDAAAALVGVNRLFHLGLSTEDLMERGVSIGADVPYCVMRGTALAEGIGEKLLRLSPMPKAHVLIGKPALSVSTKKAYDQLNLEEIQERPDIDGMKMALEAQDLRGVTDRIVNVFEPGLVRAHPVIGQIRDLMKENGAMAAAMSGSGPTVFGIYESRTKAQKAGNALRKSGLARTVHVCGMYNSPGDLTAPCNVQVKAPK